MTVLALLASVAAPAILVLPGWILARRGQLPVPALAGLVAGAVALLLVVMVLDAFSLPLTIGCVGGAWAVLIAMTVILTRRVRPICTSVPTPVQRAATWLLILPLIPACAVVVYRAVAQPLFGVDTIFRWNYLAEEMWGRSSLHFYPPVSASDYAIYAWPDGIAPVVSSLYFWIYRLADSTDAHLTAPLVVLQVGLLLAGIYALARRAFSPRAGAFAAALAACSPVLLWASAMGQETGLTALAVVALFLYLPRERSEEQVGAIVVAALAASLGALAREYGLVLPVLGLLLCVGRRLSVRAFTLFGVVALLAVAPWYLRNWQMTGNPLFNLSLNRVFPVNEVHAWLNESYAADLSWTNLPAGASRVLIVNCLAALIGIIGGLAAAFRAARALVFVAVVFVVLWAVSLPYTAAGLIFSLRMLSPALALAAVLGGAALARVIPDRKLLTGTALGLTLFATDAALRALTLPANIYRVPVEAWLRAGNAIHAYHARPVYRELARTAGSERLLVLGPNALLTRAGASTTPLWSPEVRFVFDPAINPPDVARRLRAIGFGYVLLNTGPANERFLAHSAFFRDPAGTLAPVWTDPDMVFLRIQAPPTN